MATKKKTTKTKSEKTSKSTEGRFSSGENFFTQVFDKLEDYVKNGEEMSIIPFLSDDDFLDDAVEYALESLLTFDRINGLCSERLSDLFMQDNKEKMLSKGLRKSMKDGSLKAFWERFTTEVPKYGKEYASIVDTVKGIFEMIELNFPQFLSYLSTFKLDEQIGFDLEEFAKDLGIEERFKECKKSFESKIADLLKDSSYNTVNVLGKDSKVNCKGQTKDKKYLGPNSPYLTSHSSKFNDEKMYSMKGASHHALNHFRSGFFWGNAILQEESQHSVLEYENYCIGLDKNTIQTVSNNGIPVDTIIYITENIYRFTANELFLDSQLIKHLASKIAAIYTPYVLVMSNKGTHIREIHIKLSHSLDFSGRTEVINYADLDYQVVISDNNQDLVVISNPALNHNTFSASVGAVARYIYSNEVVEDGVDKGFNFENMIGCFTHILDKLRLLTVSHIGAMVKPFNEEFLNGGSSLSNVAMIDRVYSFGLKHQEIMKSPVQYCPITCIRVVLKEDDSYKGYSNIPGIRVNMASEDVAAVSFHRAQKLELID